MSTADILKLENLETSGIIQSYHMADRARPLRAGLGTNVPQQDIFGGVGISIHPRTPEHLGTTQRVILMTASTTKCKRRPLPTIPFRLL